MTDPGPTIDELLNEHGEIMVDINVLQNHIDEFHKKIHEFQEHIGKKKLELEEVRQKIVALMGLGRTGPKPPKTTPAQQPKLDGGSAPVPKAIKETIDVMKAVGQPVGATYVTDKLGIKREAVYLRFKRAVAMGVIRKVSRGKYECC